VRFGFGHGYALAFARASLTANVIRFSASVNGTFAHPFAPAI